MRRGSSFSSAAFLHLALLGALFSPCWSTARADVPNLELIVEASDAAEACADRAELEASIAAQLSDASAERPPLRTLLELDRGDEGWLARLSFFTGAQSLGERELSASEAEGCPLLRESIALAVALVIDQLAVTADAEPEVPTCPPPPSPSPPLFELRARLRAGALLGGLLPEIIAFAGDLSISLDTPYLVGFELFTSRTSVAGGPLGSGTVSASAGWTGGALRVGPLHVDRLHLFGMVGAAWLDLDVHGAGFLRDLAVRPALPALVAGADLEFELLPELRLDLGLLLIAPLLDYRISADGSPPAERAVLPGGYFALGLVVVH